MSGKIAAVGARYARPGPIGKMVKIEKFELSHPKNQLLLKLVNSPVHRHDAAVINGTCNGRRPTDEAQERIEYPRCAGVEGLARIESAGELKHFASGSLVWVASPFAGTWASHTTADANAVTPISDDVLKALPHELISSASSLVTAHRLLTGYAHLKKGDVIVQNGGSSLTSLVTSALAASMGVTVYTAAAPGPRFNGAVERHKKYGSVVVPYNSVGMRQIRDKLGAANGVKLFLNGVGGRYFNEFTKLIDFNGHVVTFGAQSGFGLMWAGSRHVFKQMNHSGFYLPRYLAGQTPQQRTAELELITGKLKTVGAPSYPMPTITLEQLPDTWDKVYIEGGGSKPVLRWS